MIELTDEEIAVIRKAVIYNNVAVLDAAPSIDKLELRKLIQLRPALDRIRAGETLKEVLNG